MSALGLVLLVLVLLLLRQNLFVVLGCVSAYAYLVFGDGMRRTLLSTPGTPLTKKYCCRYPCTFWPAISWPVVV